MPCQPRPLLLRAKFFFGGGRRGEGLLILNGPGSQPKIDPREEWLIRAGTTSNHLDAGGRFPEIIWT